MFSPVQAMAKRLADFLIRWIPSLNITGISDCRDRGPMICIGRTFVNTGLETKNST